MTLETLTIKVTTTQGEEVSLPRPLRIKLTQSVDEPAGLLTLTYLPEAEIPECTRIKIEGDISFFGVVDSKNYEQTENGRLVLLKCRTIAALLLDNHAMPMEFMSPTPDTVLTLYCSNMGFQGFLYDEYHAVPSISATRGTSCWAAVEAFCEQAFGRPPHITEDNFISCLPYGDSTVHTFGEGGYPICSIERVVDSTKVLSGATIRDENGNYSISVTNPDCPVGIRRYHFITPEAPWLYYRELYGKRTLRRSMRGYRAINLKTPTAFALKIGDRAVIEGDDDDTLWRIAKFTLTADENGIQTDITLHDSEFFE